MKTSVSVLLLVALILVFLPAGAEEPFFPADSCVYDGVFAQQALQIAESTGLPGQGSILAAAGYQQVGVYNTVRPAGDGRHIAAYAVYDQALADGRRAVILTVRPTGEGEWPLNMDLMPSGNYDLEYAENFFLAAQDVLDTQADYLASLENPVFLVTGYSRGAAVANILGARLTDAYGPGRVYCYTFATPRTVRGEYPAYGNIFNVVNPCDLVTYLPFPQWGFERYGTDIVLPLDGADEETKGRVKAAYNARADRMGEFLLFPEEEVAQGLVATIAAAFPTVAGAYTHRHALTHPGLAGADEPGMTGAEMMLALMGSFMGDASDGGNVWGLNDGQGAENDFSPILEAMFDLMFAGEKETLGMMHMPATYGAWMTEISD